MTTALSTETATPAGLLQRYTAWSLDATLLLIPMLLVGWPWLADAAVRLATAHHALILAMGTFIGSRFDDSAMLDPGQLAMQMLTDADIRAAALQAQQAAMRLVVAPIAVYAALAIVWHAAFESSAWQASPGKRSLGLRVTDRQDRRLTPLRAVWRQLTSTASWLSLNLGHVMIRLGPRHQALHDVLSKTRVVSGTADIGLPKWARIWVASQWVLLLAAVVSLAHLAQSASDAAIDAIPG